MIQANELRVGNYVTNKLGAICIITQVGSATSTEYIGGRCIKNNYWYNYFNPIPLTEEILLKCGFSVQEGNKGKYYQHTESSAIRIWQNDSLYYNVGNDSLYYNVGNDSLYYNVGKHCYDKDTCIWISNTILLHHLQNLYFALTHEELEVNL